MRQKGLFALLRGEAPDIYRLDEVPGISHPGLFLLHQPLSLQFLAERASGRSLEVEDFHALKDQIARQEGVVVNRASRLEDILLYALGRGQERECTIDQLKEVFAGKRTVRVSLSDL